LRGYAARTITTPVRPQEPSDALDMLANGARLAAFVAIKMAAYSVAWPAIVADVVDDTRHGILWCRRFVLMSTNDDDGGIYPAYPCDSRWQFAFDQTCLASLRYAISVVGCARRSRDKQFASASFFIAMWQRCARLKKIK
jgi:hypothetical protein